MQRCLTYGFTVGLDAGSIHVDKELCLHLYEQLFTEPDLRELDVEDMHEMVDDGLADFRGDGKLKFSSPTDHLEVKIGGPMMNYPRIQISRGVMRIERYARFIPGLKLADDTLINFICAVRRQIYFSGITSNNLLMK